MWNDAQSQVSDRDSLERLYTELLEQDRLQRKVKKAVAMGNDENGLLRAEAEEKLRRVRERYGLEDEMRLPEVYRKEAEETFQNEGTRMLWMRARANELHDELMETLKNELHEYDASVTEHESNMKEYDHLARSNEVEEDATDKLQGKALDGDLTLMHQKRKESHLKLKRQYQEFESRVNEGIAMDEKFFELKLESLRKKATEIDATDERRESIISHLNHFEENIKKYKRLKEKMQFHEEMENESHIKRSAGTNPNSPDGKKTEVKEKMGFVFRVLKKIYKNLVTHLGQKDEL